MVQQQQTTTVVAEMSARGSAAAAAAAVHQPDTGPLLQSMMGAKLQHVQRPSMVQQQQQQQMFGALDHGSSTGDAAAAAAAAELVPDRGTLLRAIQLGAQLRHVQRDSMMQQQQY
jgi:hypothetical protein